MAEEADPHRQVGRTRGDWKPGPDYLAELANRIAEILELKSEHRLLDLCCGNGMLTRELARICGHVTGVDLSRGQIAQAISQNSAANIQYLAGDASESSSLVDGSFDRMTLWFSFQYFGSPKQGQKVLSEMRKLISPNGLIMIGDVPSAELIRAFYPKWKDRIRYSLRLWAGRSDIGKFWGESEMRKIADAAGFKLEVILQPEEQPYSHYRKDFLLRPV